MFPNKQTYLLTEKDIEKIRDFYNRVKNSEVPELKERLNNYNKYLQQETNKLVEIKKQFDISDEDVEKIKKEEKFYQEGEENVVDLTESFGELKNLTQNEALKK